MFAIPGICALIIFILARPQEFFTLLQRIPFLHLFALFALLGWIIDVRLRRLQPVGAPSLPWVIALLGWALLCTAVKVPETLMGRAVELGILFVIYGTIAHGIQKFRTFQRVAAVLAGTCLFITALCFYEGRSPTQCVGGVEAEGGVIGEPDGRECETSETCRIGPEAQSNLDYKCEHVGAFGMYSVEKRVRYIGELHDPNEVALVIATGAFSMLIAFILRKKSAAYTLVLGAAVVIVLWTVLMTQSRGGLVTAMIVPGVYVIRKWGLKMMIPAAAFALPVMALSGRGGESANESTALRYEAWQSGLQMFHQSPLFGVGAKQFSNHHFITAHNSYVLVLAELGIVGLILFMAVLYISAKTLIIGMRELREVPGTEVAQVWGMALLASIFGAMFQINTLSFSYHSSLWVLLGMCGAWYSCVKAHRPEFTVKMTARDFVIVVGIALVYGVAILPVFLRYKGY